MTEPVREYAHNDYTVGWICALPEPELVVARAMLDEEHPVLSAPDPNDTNSYLLGRIGPHNVVIACLPAEDTGKVSAAVVAKDMLRTFKAIRFGLMVGVGGGAPSYPQQPTEADEDGSDQDSQEDNGYIRDIRLEDVVISLQTKLSDAVVQWMMNGLSLVDENLLNSQSNGNTIVCYFFFRDTSDVQRSPTAAIAALLHQVFKSKFGESLIRYALPRFKSDGAKLSTNLSAMWAIIEDIEKDINSPQMVFVIDALDECERSEQGRFIESVERLEQQRRKSSKPVTLKILITSRPYWKIEKGFQDHYRGAPCIRIPGEDQSHSFRLDIDSVVNAQVWGLGAQVASEKAREQLLRGLLGYKNRTYLWVHLVFKILETEPRIATDTVHDILSNLPDSVEEAYVNILNKSRNSEQARKLLYIIVGAREPLFVEDIGVALYVTSNSRTYQDLELPTGRQLEITLRDLCGLFISVVENRVYLIHQTAKEFLVKPPGTQLGAATDFWKHSLCMKEADLILLKSCLWLLSFDVFEKTPEQFDLTIDGTFNGPLRLYEKTPKANAWREYLNNHLFLGYSGKYWTVHFRGIEAVDETMLDLAFSICDTRSTRSVLWPLIFLGDGLIGGEDFSDGLILLRDGPILALATTGIEELMAPLLAL
ncbi:hypothetical protein HYALB_00006689 [Hymenoscyphus albidus]|uniref:NACHT domain-containing protein n=1 Tax=Hymenoscyphus albidus TaxID=595503 RepID=A0A9N9LKT0_9HELO|nr:hypothetical protein HYALB_00006689 [Hymenoscyphus albidus]